MSDFIIRFSERGCYSATFRVTDADMEGALKKAKAHFGYNDASNTSYCIWSCWHMGDERTGLGIN